jgi:hypothetical protein
MTMTPTQRVDKPKMFDLGSADEDVAANLRTTEAELAVATQEIHRLSVELVNATGDRDALAEENSQINDR